MRSQDVNVLALVKGEERYIFIFTDEDRKACMDVFYDMASRPELSFTGFDAMTMVHRMNKGNFD